MTSLDQELHDIQMADMASFDEEMPSVGIFWYDEQDHSFFGVRKDQLTPKMVEEAAEKGLPFINYPHLHRQVWAKEFFRAQAKHEETKFKGDYTQIPCGRVSWNIDKFIVFVANGLILLKTNSQRLLKKPFIPLTSSLYMMSIGIWAMDGRVTFRNMLILIGIL